MSMAYWWPRKSWLSRYTDFTRSRHCTSYWGTNWGKSQEPPLVLNCITNLLCYGGEIICQWTGDNRQLLPRVRQTYREDEYTPQLTDGYCDEMQMTVARLDNLRGRLACTPFCMVFASYWPDQRIKLTFLIVSGLCVCQVPFVRRETATIYQTSSVFRIV